MDSQSLHHETGAEWVGRNKWRLGLVLAAVLGGVWWRSGRSRRIDVDRVSERWLAEQAFHAGQHPLE